MKTKLIALLAIGLSVATVLSVAGVGTTSSAPPISPRSTQIRNNIVAMLQRKAPIKVLPDIPGGAPTATNQDAAYFAWQEFVALNWPNVPVTGKGGAGARELADASLQFGQPARASSVAYPALVWESTRHRSEVYTGTSTTPHGYTTNASQLWGYNSTPGYVYPNVNPAPSPAPGGSDCSAIKPGLTPFVNLDEGSQIGTCKMYSGVPYASGGPENFVFFMAKANATEYAYIASRGWYNTTALKKTKVGSPASPVATFQNTSGYILTQGKLPPPGNVNGSSSPGNYVSFPSGTLEFKAAFRIANDAERQAYENGQPIPGGYHVAPIRYYREMKNPQGKNVYQYVDTCGVLLSLHIIHKTPSAPYFIFATFEHQDDVIGPDGKPVEDADGNLNPNAFTSTQPTPVPSPFVYPSSGTAPAGKYLIDATSPNVLEIPSQYTPGASSITPQQFMPSPTSNAGPTSPSQSYYQNTREAPTPTPPATPTPTPTPTLPAADSPSLADSYLTVNRRRFSIPAQPIIQANQDVHGLIGQYGFGGANNTWLHYKLVNVQWIPAGNSAQKTPGKLYGDKSGGARPSIPVESFYLSNSLVETNMILAAFSGKFAGFGDGLSITDFYDSKTTTYTDYNTGKSVTKNLGDPFYNVYFTGGPYNMGGCMGCHANATVVGTDASFILKGAPFVVEGVETHQDTMLARHRSYFHQ
jgi:hypothetical protein